MDLVIDIGVSKIYTIVKKTTADAFHYVAHDRSRDGFVLFSDGYGYFIDRNNHRHSFTRGTVMLLKRGDNYEIHSVGPCSYIASAYDLQYSDDVMMLALPIKVDCGEEMIRKIEEICAIWQRYAWDSCLLCRSHLLKMYYELCLAAQATDSEEEKDIVKAKQYIHKSFGREFSFSELCRVLSISPSYLRAKFKKHTGLTISEYRDRLRMERAKEMLESGFFTLKEIAFSLGYYDPYHFSKAFKKAEGVSPGRRKTNKEK